MLESCQSFSHHICPWRRRPGLAARWATAILILCVTAGVDAGHEAVKLCSADSPLRSPYFVPFFEETRQVSSHCVSREMSPENYFIHVLRIDTSAREVILTLTENEPQGAGLILVLDSPRPLKWRIDFVGSVTRGRGDFSRWVALPTGSRVISSNFPVEIKSLVNVSLSGSMTDRDFTDRVRTHFRALTTFARISEANRVMFNLNGPDPFIPGQCDPQDGVSRAIHGMWVSKQRAFGCFHPGLAGVFAADVHIIDLHPDGMGSSVALSILPEAGYTRRNLTLVLRSSAPLEWILQTLDLTGKLTVIVDAASTIHDKSTLSYHQVEIKTKPLPAAMDELWRAVIGDTDITPMSYIRVARANILALRIPKPSTATDLTPALIPKPSKSNTLDRVVESLDQSDMAQKTVLIPGNILEDAINNEVEQGRIQELVSEIRSGMTKQCSQIETIIAIERSKVDHNEVSQMTLNDPKCLAEKNETHWIVKSQSTSCGSLNVFSGSNPMFRNNVILQFSRQSRLFKKKIQIPFFCRVKPGLHGEERVVVEKMGGLSPTTLLDTSLDGSTLEEMYAMTIKKRAREDHEHHILVEHRDQMADVALGDELTVQTSFDTKSFLNLAIERCWLSDLAEVDPHTVPKQQILIWEGCPTETSVNVTLFPTYRTRNPAFAFEVVESMMDFEEFFLFCLIGLCSPDPKLSSGNLGLCRDPSEQCGPSQRWHESAVAQQLTRRGPFRMFPYLQDASFPIVEERPLPEENHRRNEPAFESNHADMLLATISVENNTQPKDSSGLRSAHVVGVPAEIAVAIGLAAFVMGAALIGLLWCVHYRNFAAKVVRIRGDDGEVHGSELQSMMDSSRPQAQAASTANSTSREADSSPETVAFLPHTNGHAPVRA
eukprot:maker-scaffold856_size87843-snap-gene-0.17 protein:Tk08368 transcript:maker-scaffold856_size87843-snap-gene-0.17-mRNA-1 annotation:"hypothetical protein DAPPUDRAFT_95568"